MLLLFRIFFKKQLSNPTNDFTFRYVIFGRNATRPSQKEILNRLLTTKLFQKRQFPSQSSMCVKPPEVSSHAKNIYEQFVERGRKGSANVSAADLSKYNMYVTERTVEVRHVRILRIVD